MRSATPMAPSNRSRCALEMSQPTKPGCIFMMPIPVLRGPSPRPRSTVQAWVLKQAGGRGPGRLTVSKTWDPTISRPPPHHRTAPTHRDPLSHDRIVRHLLCSQAGLGCMEGGSSGALQLAETRSLDPPSRPGCRRAPQDDGRVLGIAAWEMARLHEFLL